MKHLLTILLLIFFISLNFAQSLRLVEESEPIKKRTALHERFLDWNATFAEDENGYYFYSAKTKRIGHIASSGAADLTLSRSEQRSQEMHQRFEDKRNGPSSTTQDIREKLKIQHVSKDLQTITEHEILFGEKTKEISFSFSSIASTPEGRTWCFYSKITKDKSRQLLAVEFLKNDFSLGEPILIKELRINDDDSYQYKQIISPDKSKFCYYFYNKSFKNKIRRHEDCEVVLFDSSMKLLKKNSFELENPVKNDTNDYFLKSYPHITNGMPNNYNLNQGMNMVLNNNGDFFMLHAYKKKIKESDIPTQLRLYAILNQKENTNKVYKDFKKEEFNYQGAQVFLSNEGKPYVIVPYHSNPKKMAMVLEGFHYYSFDKNLELELKTDNRVRDKFNAKLAKQGYWKKASNEKYWYYCNLKHSYNFKNGKPLVLFEGYYHTTAGYLSADVYMFQLDEEGKAEWAAAIDKEYLLNAYGKNHVGLFIDMVGNKLVYALDGHSVRHKNEYGKGIIVGTVDYDGKLRVKNLREGKDFLHAEKLRTMKNNELIGIISRIKYFQIIKFKLE